MGKKIFILISIRAALTSLLVQTFAGYSISNFRISCFSLSYITVNYVMSADLGCSAVGLDNKLNLSNYHHYETLTDLKLVNFNK